MTKMVLKKVYDARGMFSRIPVLSQQNNYLPQEIIECDYGPCKEKWWIKYIGHKVYERVSIEFMRYSRSLLKGHLSIDLRFLDASYHSSLKIKDGV